MRLLVFIIICTAIVQACRHRGRYRRNREKWVEGRFRLECEHRGTQQVYIIGCVTPRGHRMAIASTYREGNKKYDCRATGRTSYVLEERSYY